MLRPDADAPPLATLITPLDVFQFRNGSELAFYYKVEASEIKEYFFLKLLDLMACAARIRLNFCLFSAR